MKSRASRRRKAKGNEDARLAGGGIGGALIGGAFGGPPGAVIGGFLGLVVAGSINGEEGKSKQCGVKRRKSMAERKVVFVAFAVEDERQRDFLKGQSLHTSCPFEFIDMSVKEAYESDWKEKVQTRIRRSHGVITLVSKDSVKSSGQQWEISCAKKEGKPLLAIWAYTDDRTCLTGVNTVAWTWDAITRFIDRL